MAVTHISTLFFTLLLVLGLAGCGKTGPLYLPGEEATLTPAITHAEPGLSVRNND